jgi:6-pyruvoyltetrahydropterin/6-carboxytetrahydropterin synthase
MVLDFADLRAQARGVLQQYDHGSWNDVLEFPSVENICELLARQLRERLELPFTMRIWEGHGKWAELSSSSEPGGAAPHPQHTRAGERPPGR